jgi:hypothetical protein
MYADPTVGGDLNMGGFDGELFARASNGATILGDGDLRFPTWPMLPVRQWVTISINLSGYATTVTQLDMNFRTFSRLPWTGTVYFDNIRIQ